MAMGSADSGNISAIRRGMEKLRKNKDRVVELGMYNLLNAALDYLHDAHENFRADLRHENESNTLGWALVHNGQIVEAVSQSKGPLTPRGDVLAKLQAIASGTTGWIGIVMSDVENGWYRLDWEADFLNYSRELTAQSFKECFQTVI